MKWIRILIIQIFYHVLKSITVFFVCQLKLTLFQLRKVDQLIVKSQSAKSRSE